MNSIEFGKDGQVLEWRLHALTDLMRFLQREDLDSEPILHPAGSWAGRQLSGIRVNSDGTRWDWGIWESVKIVAYSRGKELAQKQRSSSQNNFMSWNDLFPVGDWQVAYCDCLELTPVDHQAQQGLTKRVDLLPGSGPDQVSFNWVRGGAGKNVHIRLLDCAGHSQEFKVWRLQSSGDGYVMKGRELNFNPDGWLDAPAGDLFGVVVVVGLMGVNGRRLLACRWVDAGNKVIRRINDREALRIICDRVEGRSSSPEVGKPADLRDWVEQWPQSSRDRLLKIFEHAVKLGWPATDRQLLKSNPTGLLRAVVLRQCDFPRKTPLDLLADRLKGDDFFQLLRQLLPELPDDLPKRLPAVQLWMIRHADDADFRRTIELWDGNDDRDLELALSLVKSRDEIQELLGKLRPETEAYSQAKTLLQEIELAPQSGGAMAPAALKEKLQALKEGIQQDLQQPVDPEGIPPITRERYVEWRQKTEGMNLWRRKLSQVLGYCETGVWEMPDHAPAHDDLRSHLERIEVPQWTPSLEPDSQLIDQLRSQIEELIKDGRDEPRDDLRNFACERLENVVKPNASIWGSLHLELRQAISKIYAEPELYAWLAPTSISGAGREDLQARVAAAQHFLAVTDEAEKHLQSWKATRLTEIPNDREELKRILFNPDHPRIAVSLERCLDLYEFLDLPRYRRGISRPTASTSLSAVAPIESFSAWWKSLREMDSLIDELEQGKVEFDDQVRNLFDSVIPDVQRLLNFNAERPYDERPGFYDQLAELHRQCSAEREGMRPRTLFALTGLLSEHDDWRKYVPPKTEEPDGVLTEVGDERV